MSASTADATTPALPADFVQESVRKFSADLDSFLAQMRMVWPHCQNLKKLRLEFDVSVTHAFTEEARAAAQQTLISEWHAQLSPFYERIRTHDATVFDACASDIVQSISLSEKYRTCDDDTKKAIFAWLMRLDDTAQMHHLYAQVPSGMMQTVQQATVDIAEKIRTGEQNASELLNMQSLAQIGMNVAEQLKEDDLQSLTQNLVSDPSMFQGLGSMFNMMQGMPPGAAGLAGLAGGAGGAGAADAAGASPPPSGSGGGEQAGK